MQQNDVKRIESLIQLATQTREDKERQWRRNIRWFLSNQWEGVVGNEFDRVTFNLIRANIKSIVTSIYFKNPKILVTPRRSQDEQVAPMIESLLNYTVEQIGVKKQMKIAITDSLLCLFGVLKIGYDNEFHVLVPEERENMLRRLTKRIFGTKKEKEENAPDNVNITPGYIWNLRKSPFDFYPDPRANYLDLSDADFVLDRNIRLLSEVKEDKYFENTNDLRANFVVKSENESADDFKNNVLTQDERETVVLWEMWNRKEKKVYTMAEGHDRLLKKVDWPYKLEGFPYEVLTFDYTPEELYGITDVEDYMPMQDALNKLMSIIQEHTKRALPKTRVNKNTDDDTIMALKMPYIDTVIKADPGSIDPIQHSNVSPDTYNHIAMLRDGINILSGVNELQRGGIPRGSKTATQAAIIERHSQGRYEEMVDTVQDFFKNLTRKNLQLMKQVYDLQKVIPIVGETGATAGYWEFTKNDIQGEFDIEIEPYSAIPQNKEMKRQQTIQMVNLLASPVFAQGAGVDVKELAARLLKEFDVKEINKILPSYNADKKDRKPDTENLMILSGAMITALPDENHTEHLQSHKNALNEVGRISPMAAQALQNHINQHIIFISQGQSGVGSGGQPNQTIPNIGLIPGLSPSPMSAPAPQMQQDRQMSYQEATNAPGV